MAELNTSEQFSNTTKFAPPASCTGSKPFKIVEITTYSILMTFSLLGNVLVVAVFNRNKTLRTNVHYFIVNMSISDLIIPVVTLPNWISAVCDDNLWLVDGVLGTLLCKLVEIAWAVSTFVSILSMIAIAADRFHAVLFPMKLPLFSRNKRRLIITAIWIVSIAFRAHYLYAAKLVSDDAGLSCVYQWEPASYTQEMSKITWIAVFVLTSLSAIVLTTLYSSIITFLYRQKSNIHLAAKVFKRRAKENLRISFMLMTIVVVFYVVWIPYHVDNFIFFLNPSIKVPCFFTWLANSVIPLLYPVVNPVVYYIFNANYRQGVRELLCCPCPYSNNCNDCFQPSVPPQGENSVHNHGQVNNSTENIELQEQ